MRKPRTPRIVEEVGAILLAAILLAAIVILAGALLTGCTGCFREAPPCDKRSLERIVQTCPNEAECLRQLDEREELCAARFRSGE